METCDIEVEAVQIYKALSGVISKAKGDDSILFELLYEIENDHNGHCPKSCEWRAAMDHVGEFTCELITLMQTYAISVVMTVQGTSSEEQVHKTFEVMQNHMKSIEEKVFSSMRHYASYCLDLERSKQTKGET